MKKPVILHPCKNRLDAYYLKNIIQKVRPIPVVIIRKKGSISLIVEYNHYDNATIILNNVLPMIPSKLIQNIKEVKTSEKVFEPKVQYGTLLEQIHLKLIRLTERIANHNLHLIS